jgi:hypothetical protein
MMIGTCGMLEGDYKCPLFGKPEGIFHPTIFFTYYLKKL